ncbi:MAG: hypothetical protein M1826_003558 [Phylliscum demangeonii]|nr:MAG: hypothetical protein M1826_003558 [Phylliscum demangeonii]
MADGHANSASGSRQKVHDQIVRLESARKLVLGDAAYYGQIIEGILPIIGVHARVELRRWGTEFLAEAFASPMATSKQKQKLSLIVLDTLKEMLENTQEDTTVLKSVVQACASIYPLVFRHIISSPDDHATWEKMTAIKSRILKIWDTAVAAIRICCIKFVQRVVQAQTPAPLADARRPEQNEVSLAMVPRDHPLIPPSNLEAEASGLLDRLLSALHDQTKDALVVNATLNSVGVLIRIRPTVANKIISAVLRFSPMGDAKPPLPPKMRVIIKSMERTTKALLLNVNKQNPTGPMASRIHQYLERLAHSRLEVLEEGSNRKRAAPVEPVDGLDQTKRARLGATVPPAGVDGRINALPLHGGPASLAQIFTLTPDAALTSFDIRQFPLQMVLQLLLSVIPRLDQDTVSRAVQAVRVRLQQVSQSQAQADAQNAGVAVDEDDDDDYEPEYQPAEDNEQILNKLDNTGSTEPVSSRPEPAATAFGLFRLPPPPPLSADDIVQIGQGIIGRAFMTIGSLEDAKKTKAVGASTPSAEGGINRLAATRLDRSAWITLITRIATRAPTGLDGDHDAFSPDQNGNGNGNDSIIKMEGVTPSPPSAALSTAIRNALYLYILEDFRRRIDTAIAWLSEEWYNDRIQDRRRLGRGEVADHQYEALALKVIDGILPYLDSKDKFFTRFVAELPGVGDAILDRVKYLARDPERVSLAVNTLHYLILFRPPIKEQCLDALEDLYVNYEEARPSTSKLLTKWRPHFLPSIAAATATATADPASNNNDPDLKPLPLPPSSPSPSTTATAPSPDANGSGGVAIVPDDAVMSDVAPAADTARPVPAPT